MLNNLNTKCVEQLISDKSSQYLFSYLVKVQPWSCATNTTLPSRRWGVIIFDPRTSCQLGMGFIPVTDLPCTVLNPIPHLDQYLIDLNSEDSLESFNQLADLVLANQPPCSPTLSDTFSFSACVFSPENNSQWLSSSASSSSSSPSQSNPSSPETSSECASSFVASPLTQLEISGSSASPPASIASSQTTSSMSRKKTNCLLAKRSRGDRQIKNASAAEKYRKKIKGRHGTLLQQMQKEQERNERLKRDLKSKLSLYREFITLLAQNTTQLDRDLANLGFKSLSTVLYDVCKQPSCSLDEELRAELETQLNTFQQILWFLLNE